MGFLIHSPFMYYKHTVMYKAFYSFAFKYLPLHTKIIIFQMLKQKPALTNHVRTSLESDPCDIYLHIFQLARLSIPKA